MRRIRRPALFFWEGNTMVMQALANVLQGGSMEERWLEMLRLADQMETLAGTMLEDEQIKPELVGKITKLKAELIPDFARENNESTLPKVLEKVAEAEAEEANERTEGDENEQAAHKLD
jgi:hypothetical protein